MDERHRKLERAIAAGEDPMARVRLANEKLRAGAPAAALELLAAVGVSDPGALGFAATTRALAFARLGRAEEALTALEKALAAGATELDPAGTLEALTPALMQDADLGRARAARILSRLQAAPANVRSDLELLARDDDPLVRAALASERPAFEARDRTTRVYGSHGPDYLVGHFYAFDACIELRLRFFEPRLFASVTTALSTLSEDATAVESFQFHAAFGDGYGLGGLADPHDASVDVAVVDKAVARLNELDLLPWKVRPCGHRNYDLMEDPGRLARRLGRDLLGHPSRQKPFAVGAPLLDRFLALHPLTAAPAARERVQLLLEEARAVYTPVGVRALEELSKFARGEQRH